MRKYRRAPIYEDGSKMEIVRFGEILNGAIVIFKTITYSAQAYESPIQMMEKDDFGALVGDFEEVQNEDL